MAESIQSVTERTRAAEESLIGSPPYLPILDSVRGVAILFVLVFHATVFTMDTDALTGFDRVYFDICSVGWSGVDMFFVLSGFLITRILLNSKTKQQYFRTFYARRMLRIFPLYYFAVVCYLVIAAFLHLQHAQAAAPWLLTYTSNLVFVFDPSFVMPLPMAHFWSLAIEEQFYLLWPMLVLVLSRRGLLQASVALFVLAFVVRFSMVQADNVFGAYRFTLCRLDSLALGGAVAVLMTMRNPSSLRGWAWFALGVSGTGLTAVAMWPGYPTAKNAATVTYSISLLALFFAAGLLLIVTRPNVVPTTGHSARVLSFFGRYSYGMYVFHQPLATVISRLKGARSMPLLFGTQIPFQVIFLLLFVGATLLIAMLSFNLMEKHFLKLKSSFEYSRSIERTLEER